MKSKTVKLISGVAVLAVLSGTYIGVTSYVDSQEEKEAEAADTSVSVVEMDSEKITSVSFNGTEGAEKVFEKKYRNKLFYRKENGKYQLNLWLQIHT